MNQLVIAFDQSYTRTGIAIGLNGKIIRASSITFNTKHDNIQKRQFLRNTIEEIMRDTIQYINENNLKDVHKITVTERNHHRFKLPIVRCAELTSLIVDCMDRYNIQVYSMSPTSWQSDIVNAPKDEHKKYADEIKPKKMPTIKFVEENLGIGCQEITKDGKIKLDKKGRIVYNDDMADAVCMCLYAFKKGSKLKLET